MIYTIQTIREALTDRNIAEVSRRTGLNRATLYNIIRRDNDISAQTYIVLVKYLFGEKEDK